jgi:hypothetical protein
MPSGVQSNALVGAFVFASSCLLRPAYPANPSAPASLGKLLNSGTSPGSLLAALAPTASTPLAAGGLRV